MGVSGVWKQLDGFWAVVESSSGQYGPIYSICYIPYWSEYKTGNMSEKWGRLIFWVSHVHIHSQQQMVPNIEPPGREDDVLWDDFLNKNKIWSSKSIF